MGCAGKQIQMNRMPGPEGDEGAGGGAQARVNVLAELPLLEARLDAPSLKITDVDQSQVGIPASSCSKGLDADVQKCVLRRWKTHCSCFTDGSLQTGPTCI